MKRMFSTRTVELRFVGLQKPIFVRLPDRKVAPLSFVRFHCSDTKCELRWGIQNPIFAAALQSYGLGDDGTFLGTDFLS
jgi:hypothetical protein